MPKFKRFSQQNSVIDEFEKRYKEFQDWTEENWKNIERESAKNATTNAEYVELAKILILIKQQLGIGSAASPLLYKVEQLRSNNNTASESQPNEIPGGHIV
jgi:hypothetical protein